ncbi:NAD(P)-binding protein [Ramicandelaber brevisporus]|nr:NAD(P)-binding protein [Ramicandelaber brevisporus]
MSPIIPASHRAVPFVKAGPPSVLEVATIAAPSTAALPDGAIIVRNHTVAVNQLDTDYRKGSLPAEAGVALGFEGAGTVVASRNPAFAVGARVVYEAYKGAYAEYIQIDSPTSAVVIPDAVSFETAASVLVSGVTALALLRRAYATRPGDTVLVWAAAGGAGQSLVQLAKKVFGARVIGVTSTAAKAQIARAAGADDVVIVPHGPFAGDSIEEHPVVRGVKALTGGRGVDAVFDSVGKDSFDASLAAVAKYGTLVSFGFTSGFVPPLDILRLAQRNIKLTFHDEYVEAADAAVFQALADELFAAVQQGKFVLPIYRTYALDEVAQAHADIESGRTHGKLLIRI